MKRIPMLLACPAVLAAFGPMAARAAGFSLIYTFQGGSADGAMPYGTLIDVDGTLYGTTYSGGANNAGIVFSITPGGSETVLHAFGGAGDGANPTSGLTLWRGALYGTTSAGGAYGQGTVYSITTAGQEAVVHSFDGTKEGFDPNGALVALGHALYGTTFFGGAYTAGTVFTLDRAGHARVLHDFGNGNDGQTPTAGLIAAGGVLYGTTPYGGDNSAGTVFSITPSGTEAVLYSFGRSSSDAKFPYGPLLKQGKFLYGTTALGGIDGIGAAYWLNTGTGKDHVLHSFAAGNDGEYPNSALISAAGILYGTTNDGGDECQPYANCNGVIFSVTRSGSEAVLYSFSGGNDGANPLGALTDVGGTLYGTAATGGANGAGTVFGLTP